MWRWENSIYIGRGTEKYGRTDILFRLALTQNKLSRGNMLREMRESLEG